MPPSPTPNAPKNIAEVKELLKDDTMVKVAGESCGIMVACEHTRCHARTSANPFPQVSTLTVCSAARS